MAEGRMRTMTVVFSEDGKPTPLAGAAPEASERREQWRAVACPHEAELDDERLWREEKDELEDRLSDVSRRSAQADEILETWWSQPIHGKPLSLLMASMGISDYVCYRPRMEDDEEYVLFRRPEDAAAFAARYGGASATS
jgi:hypothetical protein